MRKDLYDKMNAEVSEDSDIERRTFKWGMMKKQAYDLEERLLEYSVRINHGD